MATRTSHRPADSHSPVLIRIVEEDLAQALSILKSLRLGGFEVEIYSDVDGDCGRHGEDHDVPSDAIGASLAPTVVEGRAFDRGRDGPDRHEASAPAGASGPEHASEGDHPAGMRPRRDPDPGMHLVASLRAVTQPDAGSALPSRIVAGPFELDRETHRVKRNGRVIHLAPTDFRLMEVFLERPGVGLSRSALRMAVWGQGSGIDERTVDVHVGRLRRAITAGVGRNPIVSIRKLGYMFEVGSGK